MSLGTNIRQHQAINFISTLSFFGAYGEENPKATSCFGSFGVRISCPNVQTHLHASACPADKLGNYKFTSYNSDNARLAE